MFASSIRPFLLILLFACNTSAGGYSWIRFRAIRQVFREHAVPNNGTESSPRIGDDEIWKAADIAEDEDTGNTTAQNLLWIRASEDRADNGDADDAIETQPNPADGTEEDDAETSTSESANAAATEEIDRHDVQQDEESIRDDEMNELISLSRSNCNLELRTNEWETRKLIVQYENLKSGVSGQCAITAYGKTDLLLAVLITNVKLNGNAARDRVAIEVLKVITADNNFNFTLKEYRWNEQYYPVILTDSHKVYIVLYFNGTTGLRNTKTSFHLELFNYYGNENTVHHHDEYSYGYAGTNNVADNIYITTSVP